MSTPQCCLSEKLVKVEPPVLQPNRKKLVKNRGPMSEEARKNVEMRIRSEEEKKARGCKTVLGSLYVEDKHMGNLLEEIKEGVDYTTQGIPCMSEYSFVSHALKCDAQANCCIVLAEHYLKTAKSYRAYVKDLKEFVSVEFGHDFVGGVSLPFEEVLISAGLGELL